MAPGCACHSHSPWPDLQTWTPEPWGRRAGTTCWQKPLLQRPGSLPGKGAGAGGCGQGAPATAVPCGSHHPAGQRGPSRAVLSSEGPVSSSAGQMWGQTWRGGSSTSSPSWCFQEASIQPSPQSASPARASRTFLATRIAAVSHPPCPPVTVRSSNSPIAGVYPTCCIAYIPDVGLGGGPDRTRTRYPDTREPLQPPQENAAE